MGEGKWGITSATQFSWFSSKIVKRRVDTHQYHKYGTTATVFPEFYIYISICLLVPVAQTSPGSHLLILHSPERIQTKQAKVAMPDATSFRIESSADVKLRGLSQLKPPRKPNEGRSSSLLPPAFYLCFEIPRPLFHLASPCLPHLN